MGNIPNKLYNFLGYSNLGLLIEQERRHWLMKTDAKKQITDLNTGELYQGEIDNRASDIIIESKKLPLKNDHHLHIDFRDKSASNALSLEYSAFPYSAGLSGLMYACIKSMNYMTEDENGTINHNNYRLRLRDCEIVSLPIAGSLNSPEVFASKWLRTTTPPSLMISDGGDSGTFTEEVRLSFVIRCPECKSHQDLDVDDTSGGYRKYCSFCGRELEEIECTRCDSSTENNTNGVTKKYCHECGLELKYGYGISNLEYFYPLSETLQPLGLTRIKEGEYVSEVVNNNSFIGYPLFWFNSDQTSMGPVARIEPNKNENGDRIFIISNEGNASKYKSKVYCGIDGNLNATPDGGNTVGYQIRVNTIKDRVFKNEDTDFNVPLDPNIRLYNTANKQTYVLPFTIPGNTKITMSKVSTWNYINETEYAIPMETFDVNNFTLNQSPLISVLDIHFDESIPFVNETKDIGYAGMRATSANIASDVYEQYPHELNKWDGLPWYLNELHPWLSPQYNALYAIHNSPGYTPGIPNSRQVAALLMDPGLSPWHNWNESSENITEPPPGLSMESGKYQWSQTKGVDQVSSYISTLPTYYEINPIVTPGINLDRYISSGVYIMTFGNVSLKLVVEDSNDMDPTNIIWTRKEIWEITSDETIIPTEYVEVNGRQIQISSVQLERYEGTDIIDVNSVGPTFELTISEEHYNWIVNGILIDQNTRGLYLSLRTNKHYSWTIKSIGSGYSVGDEFEFYIGPVQIHGRIQRMIDTPEPWYQDVPTYEISLIYMPTDGFVPASFLKEGPIIDYLTSTQFRLRCPVCRDGSNLPWNGKDEHHVEFDLRDPTPTHCDRCKAALIRGRGEGLTLTLHVDPIYWNWLMSAGMLDNDQRGRVFVISNDPAKYENNATTAFPKEPRTVARICDIPTHMGHIQNVNGVEQFPVVDHLYLRNTASFGEEELDRIVNTHASRWVRPIHIDENRQPVSDMDGENHDYVFKTVEALQAVDLINNNYFRTMVNLNVLVDPKFVQVAEIIDHGEGYEEGDSGVVIIGGFSFSFEVKSTHPTYQGGVGQVLELDFYPTNPLLKPHLSNFDLQVSPEPAGITVPYGTSTVHGNGSGLTFTMRIINYEQIRPRKGELFDDLYALVDMEDGLWMWNYRIDPDNTQTPRRGKWQKEVQISFKDAIPAQEGDDPIDTLDLRESFLTSIIPSLQHLDIHKSTNYEDPTTIIGYQTANFINIIDKQKTPLNDNVNTNNNVDIAKFVCKEIIQVNVTLPSKTGESVFQWLKNNHRLWFDCYVIWRWINPGTIGDSLKDHRFEYGIIIRSFNNFMSTDQVSLLPSSQLRYKRYVHTNIGTHVVWNVDNIGTMMWTYNPRGKMKESYRYDEKSREIKMNPTKPFTWMDIDIRNNEPIVDEVGNILWHVMTNNPISSNKTNTIDPEEPIYQQPEFTDPYWIRQGTRVVNINTVTGQLTPVTEQPIGMWQLVFPDVTHFSLRTLNPDIDIKHFDPLRLQTIRTKNLDTDVVIEDVHGNDINHKTMLINDDNGTLRLRLWSDPNGRFKNL